MSAPAYERLRPLLTCSRTDYCTPAWLLERVEHVGPIGLDPCSNAESIVPARTAWREGGLVRPWSGHGLVFENAPWGRRIRNWVDKTCVEADNEIEIVSLWPARVDTAWWGEIVRTAQRAVVLRRRVKYVGMREGAPFPTVVAYFGHNRRRFDESFSDLVRCELVRWPR